MAQMLVVLPIHPGGPCYVRIAPAHARQPRARQPRALPTSHVCATSLRLTHRLYMRAGMDFALASDEEIATELANCRSGRAIGRRRRHDDHAASTARVRSSGCRASASGRVLHHLRGRMVRVPNLRGYGARLQLRAHLLLVRRPETTTSAPGGLHPEAGCGGGIPGRGVHAHGNAAERGGPVPRVCRGGGGGGGAVRVGVLVKAGGAIVLSKQE